MHSFNMHLVHHITFINVFVYKKTNIAKIYHYNGGFHLFIICIICRNVKIETMLI